MAGDVRIVAKKRKQPDLALIASALIDLVLAEHEREQANTAKPDAHGGSTGGGSGEAAA